MGTILFDDIVFGPVNSRRLGLSLGINLLPTDGKICNFDCLYCECGFNKDFISVTKHLPTREEINVRFTEVTKELKNKGIIPDIVTFAGNGEPTLHPEFPQIIDDVSLLLEQELPQCKIAVLSNGTTAHMPEIFYALNKISLNILKLDSAIEETIRILNRPGRQQSINSIIETYKSFNGKIAIQTLFCRGTINNISFDNTTVIEVSAWLNAIKDINPSLVMLYSISREAPLKDIEKAELDELRKIAKKVEDLGFETQIS